MKKNKIVFITVILLSCIILSSCSFIDGLLNDYVGTDDSDLPTDETADISFPDEESVYNEVLSSLSNHENEFDFPSSDEYDSDYYCKIINTVLDEHRELFWYKGFCSCLVYSGAENHIEITVPSFFESVDEELAAEDNFNRTADGILSSVPAGADDYTKALYIHDYLIQITEYDSDYAANVSPDSDDVRYYELSSPYGPIIQNKAMCLGYSTAFQYFMSRLGIECCSITGTGRSERHAWNAVKIDGEWYNVDVTWDDVNGEVLHKNFLVNDNEFYLTHTKDETKFSDMDFKNLFVPECTGEKDNYFTRNGLVFSTYDANNLLPIIDSGLSDIGYITVKFTDETEFGLAIDDLMDGQRIYDIDSTANKTVSYRANYPFLDISVD